MNKEKKNKKLKVCLGILSLIIISIGVFFYMLFWNSSYTVSQAKISSSIVDDIKKSYNQDLVLEINTEDLNGIINMYFKNVKSFGKATIKGVHADILDNNLRLYIPTKYNDLSILISTEGQLLYKDNKVVYKPDYFKAGKISMPKSVVLDKLKGKLKKGMVIEDNSIVIDKSLFVLDIKSMEIKEGKIFVGVKRPSLTLEEKLKSLQQGEKVSGTADANSKANSSEQGANKEETNSTEKVISSSQNSAERNEALNRINSGLSAAMSSVSTGGQKAVISQMISVVNTMKGNPSYNPYSAESSVRATYKKLTPKEKSELKSAVFSNVDGESINIVSKMMGM